MHLLPLSPSKLCDSEAFYRRSLIIPVKFDRDAPFREARSEKRKREIPSVHVRLYFRLGNLLTLISAFQVPARGGQSRGLIAPINANVRTLRAPATYKGTEENAMQAAINGSERISKGAARFEDRSFKRRNHPLGE